MSCKCTDVIYQTLTFSPVGMWSIFLLQTRHPFFSTSDTIDIPLLQSRQFVSRRRWFSSSSQKVQLENALMQTMDRLEASGINGMWEEWKLKFLEALDPVAPVVTTRTSIKKRRCPWMTQELLNIIHKQKSAYRKVIRSDGRNSDAVKLYRLL